MIPVLAAAAAVAVAPYRLRVNHIDGPTAVDPAGQVSFSWAVRGGRGASQTEYTLAAAPAADPSRAARVTRRTQDTVNQLIPGIALGSDEDWVWNVTLTSGGGVVETAQGTFSTALSAGAWGGSAWVRRAGAAAAGSDLVRLQFTASPQTRCRVYVASPGFARASVNGAGLGTSVLGHKTHLRRRVMYDAYDCTGRVRSGNNTLGLYVGNGWGGQAGMPWKYSRAVRAVVSVGGRIVAGTSARDACAAGPAAFSDMYAGEVVDGRVEAANAGWSSPDHRASDAWERCEIAADAPTAPLVPSQGPAVVKAAAVPALTVQSPRDGVFVADLGRNIAGWARVRIPPNWDAGANVTFTFSEELSVDGSVAQLYNNVGPGTYVLRGDGREEVFESSFTYWGFQYVQVEGYPGAVSPLDLTGFFVHSDLPDAGAVVFGGPASGVLNRVAAATRASELSNWNSIHTDCPTREKHGWLGDTHMIAETDLYAFTMHSAYSKFLDDVADAQVEANQSGLLPDIVPEGMGVGDPIQTAAYVVLASLVHAHYGDTALVRRHYAGLRRYLTQLGKYVNASTGVIPRSPLSRWGDWCPAGRGPQCPAGSGMLNTFYYSMCCREFAALAAAVGNAGDEEEFGKIASETARALHETYWNGSRYVPEPAGPDADLPAVTAQVLPLALGATPAEDRAAALAALRSDFVAGGSPHVTSGIVGTRHVLPVLSQAGMHDVAVAAAAATTKPSWGYWVVEEGATTLWEQWPSSRRSALGSKNHVMFGSQAGWYSTHVAGLRVTAPAWESAAVTPHVTRDGPVSSVSMWHDTVRGVFRVRWRAGPRPQPLRCVVTLNGWNASVDCGEAAVAAVPFASFGVPVGQCGAYDTSFCSGNDTLAAEVVGGMCVGKNRCLVPSSVDVFGDPCPAFAKLLAIQWVCTSPPEPVFQLNVTLPSRRARVDVPTLGAPQVTVKESGEDVWRGGEFVAGVAGVVAGNVSKPGYVTFEVLSGSYRFAVW